MEFPDNLANRELGNSRQKARGNGNPEILRPAEIPEIRQFWPKDPVNRREQGIQRRQFDSRLSLRHSLRDELKESGFWVLLYLRRLNAGGLGQGIQGDAGDGSHEPQLVSGPAEEIKQRFEGKDLDDVFIKVVRNEIEALHL